MQLVERRIGLLFAVFLLALAIGATKAAWLGVVKAGSLQRAAVIQQEADITIPARRGSITDVHGNDLAVSQPAVDIAATTYLMKDVTKVARQLSPLIGVGEDTLLRKLAKRTGFVYLGRAIPEATAERIQKLDIAGLEYALNKQLTGTDGERKLVKDAMGEPIEMRDVKPVRPGHNVRLTLDKNIQDTAESVLKEVGAAWKPKGATALVMDPNSGAILALANWPLVNANALDEAPDYARQNRAISANYEPGSTFKAFTVAAALEDGKVTPDEKFSIPPTLAIADRTLQDAEDHGWESLSTAEILKVSSNIGAVLIARKVGTRRFDQWIHKWGFGKPTGVDLPGEEQGQVLPLDKYSGSTMGNLPIGQGISVTPMQMAAGYAAIANGGILRAPHIIDSIGGKPTKKPAGRRVISEATAASLRTMLEGVLGPGGTASGAEIKGYTLAGKTGTAEKAINGEYSKDKYVASFIGFAPAQHPKLLVAVMVDEPTGDIYGGQVAAPAWREIVNSALNYLKIAPE